jgi:hypothetical protein
MNESPNTIRIAPRQPLVPITALTMLVVIPGNPSATKAFTDDEAEEALRYANEHGGRCDPLPRTLGDG